MGGRLFVNDAAATEIYTLSLHGALPISRTRSAGASDRARRTSVRPRSRAGRGDRRESRRTRRRDAGGSRLEEHTSELQSRQYLVCRLLPEKKNTTPTHALCYTSRLPRPP